MDKLFKLSCCFFIIIVGAGYAYGQVMSPKQLRGGVITKLNNYLAQTRELQKRTDRLESTLYGVPEETERQRKTINGILTHHFNAGGIAAEVHKGVEE